MASKNVTKKKKRRKGELTDPDEIAEEFEASAGSAWDPETNPMHRRITERKNFPHISDPKDKIVEWLSHQQKMMKTALKLKLVCPVCEKENCKKKCAKCKSVYYCGKECQKEHWKLSHKNICKEFSHVVEIYPRMESSCAEIFILHACEVLYSLLSMRNINAEVIRCMARITNLPIEGAICPCFGVVIADERILDPTIMVENNTFLRPGVDREYAAFPDWDSAGADILQSIEWSYLDHRKHLPTSIVFDKTGIDPEDLQQCKFFEIWVMMEKYYHEVTDKETLIKLYTKEKIQKLNGAMEVDFQKCMDIILKQCTSDGDIERTLSRRWIQLWRNLGISRETRKHVKFNPYDRYDWEDRFN